MTVEEMGMGQGGGKGDMMVDGWRMEDGGWRMGLMDYGLWTMDSG